MPIARFQLEDGRIARFEVPDGITPEQAQQMVSGYDFSQIKEQPKTPENTSFWQDVKSNAENAISSAGDLLSGNYEDIGRTVSTPRTAALGDKLFPPGSEGTFMDAMRNLGNTNPSDWSGTLLEKFGNTPEGKALAVIGGLNPVYNVAGTAYNKYVVPGVSDLTGIAPENIQLATLLGGTTGLKSAGKIKDPNLVALSYLKSKVASNIPEVPGNIGSILRDNTSGRPSVPATSGVTLPTAAATPEIAMEKVFNLLQQQYKDPAELRKAINSYGSSQGKALVELGDEGVQRLAEGAAQFDKGGKVAAEYFGDKISVAPETVKGSVYKNISPNANYLDEVDKIVKEGRTEAGPYYTEAYKANQSVMSPVIRNILNTPQGKSALKEAVADMQNEMVNPAKADPGLNTVMRDLQSVENPTASSEIFYHGGRASGIRKDGLLFLTKNKDIANLYADSNFSPDTGYSSKPVAKKVYEFNVDLKNPAPTDVVVQEAKKMGVDYRDSESGGPAILFDNKMYNPKFVTTLVERLKKLGYDGAAIADEHGKIADTTYLAFDSKALRPAGQPSGFNLQTLDYVKRGFDQAIRKAKYGQNADMAEVGRLTYQKNQLLNQLDQLDKTGMYAKARSTSSDYLSAREAAETGLNILKMDREELGRTFKDYTPADKKAFRIGVMKALREHVDNTTRMTPDNQAALGRNTAAFLQNKTTRDKLNMILSKREYDDVVKMAQATDNLYLLRNRVMGNSATARRLASMSDFDNATVDAALQIAQKGATRATFDAVIGAIANKFKGMSNEMAGEVARILFETDPKKKYQIVRSLTNIAEGKTAQAKIAQQKLTAFWKLLDAINARRGELAPAQTGAEQSQPRKLPTQPKIGPQSSNSLLQRFYG